MKTHFPLKRRALSIVTAAAAVFGLLTPLSGLSAKAAPAYQYDFTITSPYADVDWNAYGQYKANLHAHSTSSDGSDTLAAMVEKYYAEGYDILGMADHGTRSLPWTQRPTNNGGIIDGFTSGKSTTLLTAERYEQILTGADRGNRGMTQVLDANEQNPASNHILSYYSSFNTSATASNYTTVAREVHNGGGTTVIAHPGRETGGPANPSASQVRTYTDIFMAYASCLGYEISGKTDGETYNDRILWDHSLMVTAPQGRNLFGFGNDDSHSVNEVGRNWMMFVMPSNNNENVRECMETGAFYTSTRRAVAEGITNANHSVSTPLITSIAIDGNTITVEGEHYYAIEWIADAEIIAAGESINLNEYEDVIGSYIRFQLKGEGGISFSQPFLLEKTDAADPIDPKDVTYTVTFDANGGSAVASVEVKDGETLSRPADPTRDGYVFKGWLLGGASFDFETPITAPIALTAAWEMVAESVVITQRTTSSASAFGDSYWYYGRRSPDFLSESTDMGALDDWTYAPTAIGFGIPGGSAGYTLGTTIPAGSGPSERGANHSTEYYKKSFTLPENFDADDLISAVGTHRVFNAMIMFVNGAEVYRYNTGNGTDNGRLTIGKYEWNNYQGRTAQRVYDIPININAVEGDVFRRDSGARDTTPLVAQNIYHTWSFTNLKAALKPGENVITCVVINQSASNGRNWFDLELNLTYDLSVTIAPEIYTVTFVYDDGATEDVFVEAVEGKTVAQPADPALDGYTFLGWFLGESEFDFDTPITGDLTLTAKWEENEILPEIYTVTFDAGEGRFRNEANTGWNVPSLSLTVEAGEYASTPSHIPPMISGTSRHFMGWYADEASFQAAESFDFDTPITADVTLTARYMSAPVASVDNASAVKDDEKIYVTNNSPGAKIYYSSTTPASWTAYDPAEGIKVSDLLKRIPTINPATSSNYYTLTVQARMEDENGDILRIEYPGVSGGGARDMTINSSALSYYEFNSVTFDADNGDAHTVIFVRNKQLIAHSQTEGAAPADPVKDGCTFAGWLLDGSPFDLEADRVGGNITLIANWVDDTVIPEIYTVTFDADNGAANAIVDVEDGETVAQPADPALDGYTFLGWFAGEDEFDFNTPITGDITLTAKWEENPPQAIPVTSLKIDAAAMVMANRNSTMAFSLILNDGASDEGIVWSTSNAALAEVDAYGTVTINGAAGMATLTARDTGSGISHSITLRIS